MSAIKNLVMDVEEFVGECYLAGNSDMDIAFRAAVSLPKAYDVFGYAGINQITERVLGEIYQPLYAEWSERRAA